ncbi:MAG: hypothetical protein V3R87_01600 [Dehalococcoidia bacterium]
MPKAATKLFREPQEAKQAIGDLKAKGFKDDEIVVLASAERAKELGADVKTATDPSKLTQIGVPEDTVSYYQYSIPSGSIVVGVQADESRVAQAQEVLRAIPVCSLGDRIRGTSPGFQKASRMTATNPMDAPMSGDFRRY